MGRLTRRARRARTLAKMKLSGVGAAVAKATTPRRTALTGVLAGGTATAGGTALIYMPAGVILAGLELVAFCLLLLDVEKP